VTSPKFWGIIGVITALLLLSALSVVDATDLVASFILEHPRCLTQCTVSLVNYDYDFIYVGINENGVVVWLFRGSKPSGADLIIAGFTRFSYSYIEVDYFVITLNLVNGSRVDVEFASDTVTSKYVDLSGVRVNYITIRAVARIAEREQPPPLSDPWGWLEYVKTLFYSLFEFLRYGVYLLVLALSYMVILIQVFVLSIVFSFIAVLVSNPLRLPEYISFLIGLGRRMVDIMLKLAHIAMKIFHVIIDLLGHIIPF
jgi:sensor histidine kinase YesM